MAGVLPPPPQSWQTKIGPHKGTPQYFLAVDKKRQQFFVFERSQPLQLTTTYLCSTGQVPGAKSLEGDLKTPEGVYFVVSHLKSGLDYEMYGKEAYTLNYPNPADKLRSKTGYGIWIHGRGQNIAPLQTQGCIALNNAELAALGAIIKPGTPVLLSNTFTQSPKLPPADNNKVEKLEKLVANWNKSWANRSSQLFDYYDTEAYTLTTEPFQSFKSTKERLFKSLDWISIDISEVQILEGPGYWVTWFFQDYKAPNLTTKGVRRLYWAENKQGEMKIIGMEWIPGLTTGPLAALAEEPTPPVDTAPRTEPTNTDPLSGNTGLSGISSPDQPATTVATITDEPSVVQLPKAEKASTTTQIDTNIEPTSMKEQARGEPSQEKQPKGEQDKGLQPGGEQANEEQTNGERLGGEISHAAIASSAKVAAIPFAQPDETPSLPEGIVAEEPAPAPQQKQEKQVANKAPTEPLKKEVLKATQEKETQEYRIKEVSVEVEAWRKAWERGDSKAYIASFTSNARQGAHQNAAAILQQKVTLWKTKAPKKVLFKNIRISVNNDVAKAVFIQIYEDKTGGGDKGTKTLMLKKINGKWLITRETWSATQ